jgi:hypothetical protein
LVTTTFRRDAFRDFEPFAPPQPPNFHLRLPALRPEDLRLFVRVFFGFASHHAIFFLLFTFDHDLARGLPGDALVGGFSMNNPII